MSDWDLPNCYTETTPKSRKERGCHECLHTIQPCERYHRLTGIWPDGPYTHITCSECHKVARCVAPDEGYKFGDLINLAKEALSECDDVPSDAPVKIWVDKWNAAGGEVDAVKFHPEFII